jgi:hypothetical protein
VRNKLCPIAIFFIFHYDNYKVLIFTTFREHFDRNEQERRKIPHRILIFCLGPCLLLSTAKQNVRICQGYSDLKKEEHLTNILSLKRLENNATTIHRLQKSL